MKKIVVFIVVLLELTGCTRNFTGVRAVSVTGGNSIFTPRRAYIRGLPTGDDSYSVGFRDGCQTILGVTGAGTLRLLPEKMDADKLSKDPMYLRGWHDGDGYCNDRLDWEGH